MPASTTDVIISLAAIFGIVGGFISRDRYTHKRISDTKDDLIRRADESGQALSERVTKVQQEYVRRSDLNGHIKGIEDNIKQMHSEQRETNTRIDELLIHMAKSSPK